MSYARWSNSRWYAYWSGPDSDEDIQGRQSVQFFSTCGGSYSFSDDEIEENLDGCLDCLKAECPGATPGDLVEAKKILEEFLLDVKDSRDAAGGGGSL